MSEDEDFEAMESEIAAESAKGVYPQLRHPEGKEFLIREQMRSTERELMLLQMQIRRTDVELRHLTDNKTVKQFETDMLRVMTLIKSIMMAMVAMETVKAFLTGGATTPELAISIGMLAMVGATSAGVMSELS